MRYLLIILVCLVSMGWSTNAEARSARDGLDASSGFESSIERPHLRATQGDGMSLSEAIDSVRRGGNVERIISAETKVSGGREVHHIKVLTKDGKTRACFVGHTHVPGVFLDDPYFDPPSELGPECQYVIADDEKAIINIGSVGQPRDRDIRASYVIVHEDDEGDWDASVQSLGNGKYPSTTVEFIRVEYDIEKAVNKVLAIPELDDFLGTRLWEGR